MKNKHEHFDLAKDLVTTSGFASCDQLMTAFKIGYNSAGRLMDELEQAGILKPFNGNKGREIVPQAPKETWMDIYNRINTTEFNSKIEVFNYLAKIYEVPQKKNN